MATWPGLCSVLASYVSTELQAAAGKAKKPDASLGKVFRRVVSLAEEERRSGALPPGCTARASDAVPSLTQLCSFCHSRPTGRTGLLSKRAKQIFAHVKEVLKVVGLASPVGAEYASVLRTHLLASPEYCAASAPATFHGGCGARRPAHLSAAPTWLQPCPLHRER